MTAGNITKRLLTIFALLTLTVTIAHAQISAVCNASDCTVSCAQASPTPVASSSPTSAPTPTPISTATAVAPTPLPTPSGCTSTPATSAALASAVSSATAGAVICPAAGTYTTGLTFSNSGTASSPIILVGSGVANVAVASTAEAINLNGKSYITIQNMTVSKGLWGIVNSGGSYISAIGDTVSGVGADGISLNGGDHQTIEHNIVFDNADTWSGSGSGISIWEPKSVDSAAGWHNIISYNESYDNCNPEGGTDGDGIIVDTFTANDYAYPTLIEENLTWGNCGAGIKNYSSAGVTILNNTNYWNQSKTLNTYTWRGEITLDADIGTIVANNLDWPNVAYNANNTAILSEGSGDILTNNIDGSVTNPMLAGPPLNLNLEAGSPAFEAGTLQYGIPTTNFAGAPISGTVDIGAY